MGKIGGVPPRGNESAPGLSSAAPGTAPQEKNPATRTIATYAGTLVSAVSSQKNRRVAVVVVTAS